VAITGEKEYGDLFIAADGANSVVRKKLFPLHEIRQSPIQELVGIITNPGLAQELDGQMVKTQCTGSSLSMGMLPCNEEQVIWYMQFNSSQLSPHGLSQQEKKDFATQALKNWPSPAQDIIAQTDFSKVFLWLTRDMELLNTFHRQNIILIGDAAHLTLPFTSQGTNSALTDAMTLAGLLAPVTSSSEFPGVFSTYHQTRAEVLQQYLEFGRKQEHRFLNPGLYIKEEAQVPLAN
jgi:FAD-dependent urate hydroxylase